VSQTGSATPPGGPAACGQNTNVDSCLVNPFVKYTLARLGLFAVVAAIILVLPFHIEVLLKLMVALLVSAGLSFALMRGMREEMAEHMAASSRERAQAKAKLRAALAGDEPEPAGSQPAESKPAE